MQHNVNQITPQRSTSIRQKHRGCKFPTVQNSRHPRHPPRPRSRPIHFRMRQTQLFSAPRYAYDRFIDAIPDGEWEDEDGIGFGSNMDGSLVCASTSGSITGERAREMLRQGPVNDGQVGPVPAYAVQMYRLLLLLL
ncbi:uncharacterized protein PpBr36_11302 [Pyricularia pennisetigena]|uniref:uncharacterized protein n=1 Tax=Pyricularia pennisetigena TaxID=1578925 RepID=UPI001153A733|nr:uncharacterized protein PpBr36_11302 [Pyricularia pennisetigena]TLS20575.1 hypothetical protein PpBr36_11302 [Pyricularia pennisetigena]